ncbi:hypothetical protein BMF94_2334 [Rhodotorula taiwanensis]|uniref:Wax synthase domain-containing protein n=1 Tax=Rhodotorula taiwanensis TaxID=741276 RepID=A0A2S5BCU2_9BASI|nr:hypothetical protein BMF94_2334 [Rhodotorula taiwanensis]
MRQYLLEGPVLPPLEMQVPLRFAFYLPISLQALLLHPSVPPTLSRLLRFALMPISVVMSFATPYRYAIEPRNQAIVVIGIMGAYGIMKSVEWGLASNLLPYTWIGFEEPSLEDQLRGAKSKEEKHRLRQQHHQRLIELRRRQAATEGPVQILRSTLHLTLSMRGAGYQFGAIATKPYSTDRRIYLRRVLRDIALTHPLLTVCAMTLLEPASTRDAFFARHLPTSFSAEQATQIGGAVTGLAMGTAVFAALTLGYSCASLLTLIGTAISRCVPFVPDMLRLPEFDPREYPPLFKLDRVPDSVAEWWSKTWHAFFARPFRFLGFKPAFRLVSPIAGKGAGRAAAVLATFAVSAWIHEFGLASSISTLPPTDEPLSFYLRWGGSIYFMSQGVGIVLEGLFTVMTGRRVGGVLGTVWMSLFVVGCGIALRDSWITQGLLREVPPVPYWSWPRYVVPMGCLQPPPLWMNSYPAFYYAERAHATF